MERARAMPRGRGRGGRGSGRGRGRARTPVADGGNRREASEAPKARELAEAGREDASGEVHGWAEVPVVWRQPQGAAADDEDDAARMTRLVEDPKEKPASADGAAGTKEPVEDPKKKPHRDESVAGEGGHASGEVPGTRRQPRCSDDDDDAAWMKQLVEDLKEKKPQRDKSVAENFLAGQDQEDASGEMPVAWGQPRGAATNDDAARMKQLVEDPKGKTAAADDAAARMKQPVERPVPAAPFDPGMIEYINVGGYVMERGAYDFIQYDLGMPPPSGEMPVAWRQKRGAATDDDAARIKQLVEDPKGKTAAADDAAARTKQPVEKPMPAAPSFDAGMIEHINVGGYVMMERDAYDFIQYDLGMPPPSLESESPEPGHGVPLRLWSWDDSSFPQSAPPPPPPK